MNDLEYYKRRVSELEEECAKKQRYINNLEEENGHLQACVDTYRNCILPRATKEAYEMIEKNQFAGIRIATCEEWAQRCSTRQIDEMQEEIDDRELLIERIYRTFIEPIYDGFKYTKEFKELLIKRIEEHKNEMEVLKMENAELHCEIQAMNAEPINDYAKELEDRHQQDCIELNRLSTTVDVLVDKLAKTREVCGL